LALPPGRCGQYFGRWRGSGAPSGAKQRVPAVRIGAFLGEDAAPLTGPTTVVGDTDRFDGSLPTLDRAHVPAGRVERLALGALPPVRGLSCQVAEALQVAASGSSPHDCPVCRRRRSRFGAAGRRAVSAANAW
jgi:hypothetical protein